MCGVCSGKKRINDFSMRTEGGGNDRQKTQELSASVMGGVDTVLFPGEKRAQAFINSQRAVTIGEPPVAQSSIVREIFPACGSKLLGQFVSDAALASSPRWKAISS